MSGGVVFVEPVDRLSALKRLRREGELTDAEFEQMKRVLRPPRN